MDQEAIFTGASGFLAVVISILYNIIIVDSLVTGVLIATFGAIAGYFAKQLAAHIYCKCQHLYFKHFKPWIKRKVKR